MSTAILIDIPFFSRDIFQSFKKWATFRKQIQRYKIRTSKTKQNA